MVRSAAADKRLKQSWLLTKKSQLGVILNFQYATGNAARDSIGDTPFLFSELSTNQNKNAPEALLLAKS